MNRRQILLITVLFCMNKIDPLFSSTPYNVSVERQEGAPEIFLRKSLKGVPEIERKLISFSNNNFVVRESLTGDQWVLRVPHEISNFLSDRRQERKVHEWASQEQISLLEVKDHDPETGYLLTRFLPGQVGSAADFQDTMKLKDALKLLDHLHSSKTVPISAKFQPLSRFLMTSSVAANSGLSLPKEVHKVADQLKQFLSQIPISCFRSVPCHNDPSPENFFSQEGSLYLHDWELAGLNDPMWDLTHLSVIAQIDPEKILSFYQTSDSLALEKMTFFRPFIFFNTVVWASLERQQPFSSLPQQTTEMLYQTFLEKIADSIKSSSFQASLQRLIQGGRL